MYPVSKETTGADIRQYIANHTLALNEQFHVDSIQSLMEKRADFFDKLLIALWCSFELNHSTLSINAVGGYGRKRLHPQSDIDLAIISEGKILPKEKEVLSCFLTKLWDLGVDVGYSVRTIEESIQFSKNDITIATNLLDLRPLHGPQAHAKKVKNALYGNNILTSKVFFEKKMLEQENRHQQAKNTALYLEPNLKNNPGGMRDVQTIQWIAQKHFLTDTASTIKSTGFLTNDETSELLGSVDLSHWQPYHRTCQ